MQRGGTARAAGGCRARQPGARAHKECTRACKAVPWGAGVGALADSAHGSVQGSLNLHGTFHTLVKVLRPVLDHEQVTIGRTQACRL